MVKRSFLGCAGFDWLGIFNCRVVYIDRGALGHFKATYAN